MSFKRYLVCTQNSVGQDNWRDPVESTYVYADREGYTFGGYPDFMSEEAQTTPFDWPALSALNTSNADASFGAAASLKPINSTKRGASASDGDAKRRRA